VPTLTAVIDDVAMRLVVDTGANVHVVDETIAFWAHVPAITPAATSTVMDDGTTIEIREVPTGLDASATMVELGFRGPASLRLGIPGLDAPTVLLTRSLSPLAEVGLAGLFSPQRAVPRGAALDVDLASGSLRFLAPSEADEALGAREGWLALSPICATNDGVPLFAVHAQIEGRPIDLVVDTGASATLVVAQSEVARALSARATETSSRFALGGHSEVRIARDTEVRVGDSQVHVAVDIQSAEPRECGDATIQLEGALGSDVLRHCRLIIGRDRAALRCPEGAR